MTVSSILSENESKMKKVVEFLQSELKAIRTGRASTGLVENVKVDYYGSACPLKQLASLAAPQADMIVIKPFDAGSVKDIEKAIKNSDLSLVPVTDGKVIRLNIPPLSEERRKQLVGQVKTMVEQAKVSIRNVRREVNKHLEQAQKDKIITEDDQERAKKQIDELTKKYTNKIDSAAEHKADEIMHD